MSKDFNDYFRSLEIERIAHSARSAEMMGQAQWEAMEDVKLQRRGARAQIESVQLMAMQGQEIESMRHTIKELLDHNLEQSRQHAATLLERDRIEAFRFRKNIWVAIALGLPGVVSLVIQLSQWF